MSFLGTPNMPDPGLLLYDAPSFLARRCSGAVSAVPAPTVGLGAPSLSPRLHAVARRGSGSISSLLGASPHPFHRLPGKTWVLDLSLPLPSYLLTF